MRDDEPAEERSEAMKRNRAWRATERKSMVESMDKLLAQAQRLAVSQYTRSAERSKWTRLAGQLLRQKDEILRGMTWEALEQDFDRLEREVYEDLKQRQRQLQRPTWEPVTAAPFVPALVKKREEDQKADENIIPEILKEEETVADKSSSEKGHGQEEAAEAPSSETSLQNKNEGDDARKASGEQP